MATVQIKSVPPEVHAELHRRADRAGQSLQEYMLALLIRTAEEPDMNEFLDYLDGHTGGHLSMESVVAAIDDAREGR